MQTTTRRRGKSRQAFCQRGHDQAIHRREDGRGYPYCAVCRKITCGKDSRKFNRSRTNAMEALLREGYELDTLKELAVWQSRVYAFFNEQSRRWEDLQREAS